MIAANYYNEIELLMILIMSILPTSNIIKHLLYNDIAIFA